MSLKEQLTADLKEALLARDDRRRDVLRMTLSALHNAEISAGGEELEDDGVLAVVAKEAKQRRESIEEFGKAGRQDLVEKEQAELAILTPYLPEQLSRDEIVSIAREVIKETGASDMKDMGKVMSAIMGRLRGRADGREVNAVVRELLSDS
jgi:uncharacterized protein